MFACRRCCGVLLLRCGCTSQSPKSQGWARAINPRQLSVPAFARAWPPQALGPCCISRRGRRLATTTRTHMAAEMSASAHALSPGGVGVSREPDYLVNDVDERSSRVDDYASGGDVVFGLVQA